MKINSMKLLVVIMLLFLTIGIVAGLFFVEIPDGNREVAYTLLGAIASILISSINNLFRKSNE